MAKKKTYGLPLKSGAKTKEAKKPISTLHLNSKDLPELKDWEVGGTYTIQVTMKQTSARIASEWEIRDESASKDTMYGSFDITAIKNTTDGES